MSVYWPIKENLEEALPEVAPLSDEEAEFIFTLISSGIQLGETQLARRNKQNIDILTDLIKQFRENK